MKYFFYSIIFFLSSNPLLAQEEVANELKQAIFNDFTITEGENSSSLSSAVFNFIQPDKRITEGSVFLNDELSDVEIFGNEGQIFKSKGKYNIQAGELQYYDKQKNTKGIQADKIQGFAIDDKIFVSKQEADSSYSFYEILAHGNLQLLVKYNIVLTEINSNPVLGTTASAGSTTGKMKAAVNKKLYYAEDANPQKLPKSKKKLLKLMGDYQDNIAATIKDKDLNIKDNNDLITIFRLYNQLSSQD